MNAQTYINDFATRSFRDVADQDYIAARMSYRSELQQPFLWSSLQCLEKYLKAILLYNRKSTIGIGHKLQEAQRRVGLITDINFDIPKEVSNFTSYLDIFGANRYLEHSTFLHPNALIELDRSVWHIRRYCYYMRKTVTRPDGRIVDLLKSEVAKANDEKYKNNPHKYKIQGGYLERVLRSNGKAYENLVWHNFFYGKRKRTVIKKARIFVLSTNPTLTLHPEAFNVLKDLVQFSKDIRKHFEKVM